MRRIYLSLLMLLGSIYANAYDIELNGLYYSYINEGRELEFDSCNAGTQVLVIPDEVTYHDRSRNVTAVGANACNKDSSIISIAIPNTVTKIGNNAFARTSIQTLIIPSSVVSIGDFAFSGCKSLVSVQFGSNVKTIGDLAFFYCTGLTKVTLPVNLERLGSEAFGNCTALTEIDIRSGNIVKLCEVPNVRKLTIGPKVNSLNALADFKRQGKYLEELWIDDLFSWCNLSLKAPLPLHEVSSGTSTKIYVGGKPVGILQIPDGVTKITKSIFNNWPITGVNVPNSVTELEDGCFANNHQLTNVVLGVGVTAIPDRCFENSGVNSIQISATLKSIGARAFYGNKFPTITLPNTLKKIGCMAFMNSKLTAVTIPNSVKIVGAGAFMNCTDLNAADINCDTLDVNAFKNDKNLKRITLGPNVKHFAQTIIDSDPKFASQFTDGEIFKGCPLMNIISYIENPFPFAQNMFEKDTYYNASLMIPGGTMNRYKSQDFWSAFIYAQAMK